MAHSNCNRCIDPMTNKKGRCVFENHTPSKAYKSIGKNSSNPSTSIPAPEEMPSIQDEHRGGDVPEQSRPKKIRKVRRKGHG